MHVIDWTIVVAFLGAVLFLALRHVRSSHSRLEYFLANRSLPIWLVTASVLATEVSAATVVGAPDTSFRTSIAYLQTTIGAVLSRGFLAYWFIPKYYESRVVTVYEFLGTKFGAFSQCVSAWVFCFGRTIASGARLYIAGIAIAGVMGIQWQVIIVIIGGLALLYCTLGGLKVVAITDALQGTVFIAVAVFVLYLASAESGGVTLALSKAYSEGKLRLFVFEWNVLSPEFWKNPYTFLAGLLGGLVLGLATHGTDQDMVQRVLAAKSAKAARRSMLLVGLAEIPIAILFVVVGIVLWSALSTSGTVLPEGESVLPFYMRHHALVGLRGMFVAAVLAAALSSLDSAINALASVGSSDLCIHRQETRTEHYVGWRSSLVFGVLLTGCALLIGMYHQNLLADEYDAVSRNTELLTLALGSMSTVYGPLLGFFVVAIWGTVDPARDRRAAAALLLSILISLVLQLWFSQAIGWTWRVVFGAIAGAGCTLLLTHRWSASRV